MTVDHVLKSAVAGDSEAEQMADRIIKRREGRIPVVFSVRKRFLKDCRAISRQANYKGFKISKRDLQEYLEKVKEEVESVDSSTSCFRSFAYNGLGFYQPSNNLLKVLEKAMEVCETNQSDWLHYEEFSFYYTILISKWPWMRSDVRVAVGVVLLYYILTPVFFCHIVNEPTICVEQEGLPYAGWLSSLYFASTTLSTVGYGDLSVSQSPRWRSLIGSFYMILSMVVAVVAFSAAAGNVFYMFDNFLDRILDWMLGPEDQEKLLRKRITRIKFVKLFGISAQFFAINLLGVLVSRGFVSFTADDENPDQQWTWMTSFYWAIQTTTTIGYGDLDMPFQMRWFQIVFLTLSTMYVGNTLGKLGDLKQELSDMRKRHVWERQKVSKRFIEEMQAYDHDDKVDQFEFLVASLLVLDKVSHDDVHMIMNKFRKLCGRKGYISFADMDGDGENDDDEEEEHAGDSADERTNNSNSRSSSSGGEVVEDIIEE